MNSSPQPQKISLIVEKIEATLFETSFIELVQPSIIKGLITSPNLFDEYDTSIYTQELASQLYKNEQNQLRSYLDLYDKKLKAIKVSYIRSRHGFGRMYPRKSLGITSFRSLVRNSMIKDTYYDFDISNAQPAIIFNICKANDIPCKALENYNINRESILKDVQNKYAVDRSAAKKLFIRLAFFGTFEGWCEEHSVEKGEPLQIITDIRNELTTIALKLKEANPELYKSVVRSKKEKNACHNILGSFFALYLQHYEYIIMQKLMKWLIDNTNVCNFGKSKFKVLTYEFDGIKLYKPNVDAYGGVDKLLQDINDIITELTGFNITFENKPIKDFYDVPILEEPKGFTFEDVCKEFELEHCKIINKAIFIKSTELDNIFMTEKQLKTAYSHLAYKQEDLKGNFKDASFIKKWLSCENPNIRRYDDIDMYPKDIICPSNIFNMWKPFAMERVTDYNENTEGLMFILNHLKILCNNDDNVFDYFTKWIGQMIQYPEIKSIVITLISDEGAGKGSFLKLMSLMLGSSRVFETTKPSRDVWGSFNPLMAGKFLINLNELSKKETIGADGEMKALVTDPTITINNKGINQINVKSYHRFIITTNKEEPIASTKNDRRNLIIKCSNEKIKDKDYFVQLNKYLDDVNVVKTCYEYFKSIKGLDTFGSIPIPFTEYQNDLKELSVSPIERFIECYTMQNMASKSPYIVSTTEIFSKFNEWIGKNKIEYNVSVVQFGIRLKNLKIDGLEKQRSNTARGWCVDVAKLNAYFEIENEPEIGIEADENLFDEY